MEAVKESLLDKVKRQVAEAKGGLNKVAEDTGVSYSWITKFHQGHIQNPGYNTLVMLANYFDKQGEKDGKESSNEVV